MNRILIIASALLVVGCSKEYDCECDGYSLQEQLWTEHSTVEDNSEDDARIECAAEAFAYESQYDTVNEGGLVVVSCNIQ